MRAGEALLECPALPQRLTQRRILPALGRPRVWGLTLGREREVVISLQQVHEEERRLVVCELLAQALSDASATSDEVTLGQAIVDVRFAGLR
jgi:hypothetical protein